MANERDVSLRISAQDRASRTFEGVAKSVRSVTDALEEQIKAAKNGEVTQKSLRDMIAKLQDAEKQLLSQEAAIEHFVRLDAAAAESTATFNKARAAYDAYQQGLGASPRTREQIEQLGTLSRAAVAAETALERATAALGQQQARLASLGINTDDIAGAQAQLAATAADAGASYAILNRAVDDYDANLRALKASQAAVAGDDSFATVAGKALAFVRALDEANTSATAAGRSASNYATAIRQIISPTDAALRSLTGLKGELEAIPQRLAASSRTVDDYKRAIAELNAVQNSIQAHATVMARLEDQQRAVRASEEAYESAKAEVVRYAEALQNAGGKDGGIEASLGRARSVLESSSRAMVTARDKLSDMRREATAAGIDLEKLFTQFKALERNGRAAAAMLPELQQGLQAAKDAAKLEVDTAGYKEVADEAVRTALAMDRLPDPMAKATTAADALSDQLRGIVDPSAQARRSLDGLEGEVQRIATEVGEAKKPIRDYQDAIYDLGKAQDAIVRQGTLISSFREQAAAVSAADDAYVQARQRVLALADALKQAGGADADRLAGELKEAEGALRTFNREALNQREKLRELGQQLQRTGIDVNQLDAAEQRLIVTARNATGVMDRLNRAAAGQGSAAGRFLGLRPHDLQNLSFQINDVFTSLASGISPMQTLAQQGPQIVQLFPGMGSAIIRLLPHLAALGAGFVAVYSAISRVFEARNQLREFEGILAAQADGWRFNAQEIVANIDALKDYGVATDEAKKAIRSFMREGLEQKDFERFGKTAQDIADVLGMEVPDAAKALAEGFTGGYDAVVKLNEQLDGPFSAAQLNTIRDMYELGKSGDAVRYAFGLLEERFRNAADESNTRWTKAVRELKSSWDELLTTFGNTTLISNTVREIDGLVSAVNRLIEAASKGRFWNTLLRDMNTWALEQAGFGEKEIKEFIESKFGKETGAPTANTTGNRTTSPGGPTNDQLEANRAYRQELQEQRNAVKELSDAEKIRAAGLKAQTEAQKRNLTEVQQAEAKAFAEETERLKIEKENAKEAEQAARKAAAEARRRESEARALQARIDSSRQQLLNDLRAMDAKIARGSIQSLEERLSAVDDTYAKLFDKVEAFQKLAGKNATIGDLSIQQYRDQLNANKELIKQQETLKFHEESINSVIAQRKTRLDEVNQRAEDGIITASDAFAEALRINQELAPIIDRMTQDALTFARAMRDGQIAAGETPDPRLDQFIADTERKRRQATSTGTAQPAAETGRQLLANEEQKLNEIIAQRNQLVEAYNTLVQIGALSVTDAQTKTQQAFAASQPAIQAQADVIAKLVADMEKAGAIAPQTAAAIRASLDVARAGAVPVNAEWVQLKQNIQGVIASNITNGLMNVTDILGKMAAGAMSVGEGFAAIGLGIANMILDTIRTIAQLIVQMYVLKAVATALGIDPNLLLAANAGGAGGGSRGGLMSYLFGGLFHDGGTVGARANRGRRLPAITWANAPRYHQGAAAIGLKSNEIPAILKRGEEVLSEDSPRNILNMGRGGGGGPSEIALRNVLVMDPDEIPRAMAAPAGERVTMATIERNKAGIKSILGINQ